MDVFKRHNDKQTTGRLLALVLLCVLFMSRSEAAERFVAVVAEQGNSVHVQFVAALRKSLDGEVESVVISDGHNREVLSKAAAVVTLGKNNAIDVARLGLDVPTINSLVSRVDVKGLDAVQRAEKNTVALYIEQPPVRTLHLIQRALPGKNRVTVAVGPASGDLWRSFSESCNKTRFLCKPAVIADSSEITAALRVAEEHGGILVLLPDPYVINSLTARNLILEAYRRGIVLVGYSRALVKAGAVMAVHSTPAQLGSDAAGLVRKILVYGASEIVADGRYPHLYTVSVNYQVARALGLDIVAESVLLQETQEAESND